MAVLGVGAYYLSRPQQQILYTGLTRDDVGRIGTALKDAGIDFDVAADGQTVTVNYGDTARARMLLAEKGLPESANSGYDLFDKVGSFGLTSFMQNVTKTRALEGELARTIQSMDGIRSARVHLVLPDSSSLRSQQQKASASVVIRTDTPDQYRPGAGDPSSGRRRRAGAQGRQCHRAQYRGHAFWPPATTSRAPRRARWRSSSRR